MTTPVKKKLIDKVRSKYSGVRSFRVTVKEICLADHPPSSASWSYSGEEVEGRETFTELKHDRTTMSTASFELLSPVYSAVTERLPKVSGKLPAYQTDSGMSVTRSYECEVTYDEEKEPHQP